MLAGGDGVSLEGMGEGVECLHLVGTGFVGVIRPEASLEDLQCPSHQRFGLRHPQPPVPERLGDLAHGGLVLAVVAEEDVEGLGGQGGSPLDVPKFISRWSPLRDRPERPAVEPGAPAPGNEPPQDSSARNGRQGTLGRRPAVAPSGLSGEVRGPVPGAGAPGFMLSALRAWVGGGWLGWRLRPRPRSRENESSSLAYIPA